MSSRRQSLGQWGETLASQYLARHGYAILAQNYRTAYGEIDLIARKDDMLVFVEVKTRATDTFGPPEDSITPYKRKHLIDNAQAYLAENLPADTDWRIDVIAIRKYKNSTNPEIVHFENAVT